MQLQYTINGINYLLFQLPVNNELLKRVQKRVKYFGGIVQGTTDIQRGGLLSNTICTLNILIPEHRAIEFSNLDL